MRAGSRYRGLVGAALFVAATLGGPVTAVTLAASPQAPARPQAPATIHGKFRTHVSGHAVAPHAITGLNVQLPIGQTISGTLTNGSADPIAGMDVIAYTADDNTLGSATTAGDGTYTIEGLTPAIYELQVEPTETGDFLQAWYTPGGPVADQTSATPIDVTSANATGIDLTPPSGLEISGTVTGTGAVALAGVQVNAEGVAGGSSGLTDGSGHYTLHAVADGTYALSVFVPETLNFRSGPVVAGTVVESGAGTSLVVSGSNLTGQDILAPAGLRITGTLTGTGASGAHVQAFGDTNEGRATAAGNGAWQVLGLWPDSYHLLFLEGSANTLESQFPLGYWNGTSGLTINEAQATNVVVTSSDRTGFNATIPHGATLSGTATGEDGAFASPAYIFVCGQTSGGCVSTVTDVNGAWSLRRLPTNTYVVEVFQKTHIEGFFGPGGYAADSTLATPISISGTSKSGVNVVLPLGSVLSGEVSDQSDVPIQGVHVSISGGVSPAGDGFTQTAADGTWQLTVRPAGEYDLDFGQPDPTPYLSGEYDAGAPGHFVASPGAGTLISVDDQGVGNSYVPITPVRVADSRTPLGVPGILQANVPQSFLVGGFGVIPSDAVAVTGNVTVVGQTAAGYLSVTPVSTAAPTTSTINFPIGDVRANNFTTPLGPGGTLAVVYKAAAGKKSHVIVDITGYFLADSLHAEYIPVDNFRALDTRTSIGLSGKFVANVPRTLDLGAQGLPTDAVAITANLTVVGQTKGGYLSVTPDPTINPSTSTLNFPAGDVRANGLTVAVDAGDVSIVYKAASGTTDVLVDISGYYSSLGGGLLFYPLPPSRLLDTRSGVLSSALAGSFSAGTSRSFVADGLAGIPYLGDSLTGNLTVVGQTKAGFVSLTAVPIAKPMTSTLNLPAGDVRANGVTAFIGFDGNDSLIYIATHGAKTQLILDVTGYFQ